MNDIKQMAILFASTILDNESLKGEITNEIVKEVVDRVSAMNIIPGDEFNKEELIEILFSQFRMARGSMTEITNNIEPWLNNEKANINFDLWKRYILYMKKKDPLFPINDLDDFTDKILDKCVNPKQNGSWDRRGMVVGHVQSGKTSNYVGLINKAVDAGYKIIIVMAGTISSLRRQTQERIDAGFVGISSSAYLLNNKENRLIGVGESEVSTQIYPFTSSFYQKADEGDFSVKIANNSNIPIGKNPVVFVIKKNKTILENLIDWLSKDPNIRFIEGQPKLFDVPALIIDDEADSASVNTAKSINEAKTINKLIRTLLNIFNQNTFIGYTATPYANLFIPQEFDDKLKSIVREKEYLVGKDLFPKDFILNINTPPNYFGAAKVFGLVNPVTGESNEPLNVFRPILDNHISPFCINTGIKDKDDNYILKAPTNKDVLPDHIPLSLENAIKSFILTCAIRRLRGQENKHNSMLIHVTLYVKWIDRVALLVNEKLEIFKNNIASNDSVFLEELKYIYENDYLPTTESTLLNLNYTDSSIKIHTWDSVKTELRKSVSKIEVRSVHGTRSTSQLEYHKIEEIDYNLDTKKVGVSVIAVGGSRLARGITLEGLSVSYYLRTTKMYDSLMQMGRWFGYRPGYVDLCRLYTTDLIFEWFNHITMATEEMRADFNDIARRPGQKPEDYKLKVRNHPGLLTITSLAKLNFSEIIEISFSGKNRQTYQLTKSETVIKNNYNAFNSLFMSLGYPKEIKYNKGNDKMPKYLIYRNCNTEIISDFLDKFQTDTPSIKNANLSDYIKSQKEINSWNVVLVSNTESRVFINSSGATDFKKGEREKNENVIPYTLKWKEGEISLGCNVRNQLSISYDSKYYFISKNQIDDISDRQIDLKKQKITSNDEIKNERKSEKNGLLLIYALDQRATPNAIFNIPIIGYSIHFPEIKNEKKVSYIATLNEDLDNDVMVDDDNLENE